MYAAVKTTVQRKNEAIKKIEGEKVKKLEEEANELKAEKETLEHQIKEHEATRQIPEDGASQLQKKGTRSLNPHRKRYAYSFF